jgi:hypothetical protein
MPKVWPAFCLAAVTAAALLAAVGPQDPASPPKAQAAGQDPPGQPPRHPLEGVYELRSRVLNGKPDGNSSRGFLAITRRHLFLHLAAPGPDTSMPLVRASVRQWKPEDEHVAMTIQLGWFTDKDGGLHAEKPGGVEKRRLELQQGGVRVVQDDRNWLEFERIE